MKQILSQIGKHSSIYMLAQIVTISLSVLMLPVYWHHFSPAEYGGVAFVDMTVALLSAALGSAGVLAGLGRYHFEAKTPGEQQTVWWTGYLLLTGLVTCGAIGLFLNADRLAAVLLGPELPEGALWIRLAACNMWADSQIGIVYDYLRAHKRSLWVLRRVVYRALLAVALALVGVVVFQVGVKGMLLANLGSSLVVLVAQYAVVYRFWGPLHFSRRILRGLLHYAAPLLIVGLLMTVMHQLNRWFLKEFDLAQVGLLTIGLLMTDRVNKLVVMPFQQIWNMLVFELHSLHREQAIRTFCFVFELFAYVMISVLFGCAVAARPALTILAQPDYLEGVPFIPILCLAQFCLALSDQFQAPTRIAKRTYLSIPGAAFGVLVAAFLNWQLVQRYGAIGAAWATVGTYFAFTSTNLLMARTVDKYPYPFRRVFLVLCGACALFLIYRQAEAQLDSIWLALAVGLGLWAGGSAILGALIYIKLHRFSASGSSVQELEQQLASPVASLEEYETEV